MRALLLAMILGLSVSVVTAEDSKQHRTFLFIGEPNATAWKFLIENPGDREATMSVAISKLGGRMLSYHWGLGDGRNYIMIRLPDDPGLIQAIYVTRLGDGLLNSYRMIELIDSPAMAAALARVPEIKAVDDLK